eukprot:1160356-Pelagomonas_calceolata.AAC.1
MACGGDLCGPGAILRGTLGERAGGGTYQNGRGWDLRQLAPAVSCCPQFGTEKWANTTADSHLSIW